MDSLAIARGEEELFATHLDDVQFTSSPHMATLCLLGARRAARRSAALVRQQHFLAIVLCAYATPRRRVLIDGELYLPRSWTADRDRSRQAGSLMS
jgi:hypothetical protein